MKIIKIIALIPLALILIMCLSQFFTNTPPVGVLVTVFRLPLQFTAQWILPLSGVLSLVLGALVFTHKIKVAPLNLTVLSLTALIFIFSGVYVLRISVSEEKSCFSEEESVFVNQSVSGGTEYEVSDESAAAGMKQLILYSPRGASVCLIHINYGGWSVQGEDVGMYIERVCEKKGYAFAQLGGVAKEEGDLVEIVRSVRHGIEYLENKYNFNRVYLIGSSAGGHLALMSAFAGESAELSGETEISVDGVIALYAPVDLDYQYHYFVIENRAKDLFGAIGDALYCSLFNGESGTLAGETAKIQEAFLGKYPENRKLYSLAKIENLLGEQKIPLLFIQGEKDSQLGLSDKERLYKALGVREIPHSVLNLPGFDHAFDMAFPEQSAAGCRSIQAIEKWLEETEAAK